MKKLILKSGTIHNQALLNDYNNDLEENLQELTNPISGDQNVIYFDTSPTPITPAEGSLQWNPTDGTLDMGMSGGDIVMQLGQELFVKVFNATGSLIPNGTPVYFSGRQGNRPKVLPAISSLHHTLAGVTTQDLQASGDGREGFITVFGYVRQIKTNYSGSGDWGTTWSEGDRLYVSKTIAGQLTNVEPTAPHHSDVVGTVAIVGQAGVGAILVYMERHNTLEDLSDVDGTPLTTDGQIPNWDDTNKYFDFDKNINDYVPYVGATADLNMGAHAIEATEDLLLKTGLKKTVVFDQVTWRDEYPAYVIPAGGAQAPDEVNHTIGGVARTLRGFDGGNTEERLSGSFEIPHDYAIGEPIEAHVHWRPATTGTGTVIWYFDYEYSPPNSAPIAQPTLQVEATIDTNKQYWQLLNTFGNLPQPSTPFSLGGKIGFNIRRTPTTDSYQGDALLEQVALHIPCDTNGSREIYIK